jgi:uncharacterized membrane protein (UPF0127 family)
MNAAQSHPVAGGAKRGIRSMSMPVRMICRFSSRTIFPSRAVLLVFPLLLLAACEKNAAPKPKPGPTPATGLPEITLRIGDVAVTAEVADTPKERQLGLMYRDSMPENHGMIFIFEEPDYRRFYMKNTRIPLDIAFIKDDGTIDQVKQMQPYSMDLIYSQHKVRYALEMNQGWFERHGFGSGDRVDLSELGEE